MIIAEHLSGYPVSKARSNTMFATPMFLVALFALIVAMHRGVTRRADASLRAQFEAEGSGGAVSRQMMRVAGFSV
ncbi:hypothetical protein E1N52_05770 [Paraburkholderia guartelaensis]|uniref:Uncharacterized protein n=1 Tax=Paraburkholderia guartelaensis TaxID=2546446 RepID=A0A4R5LKD6_9BURK|nr:hypothetical protein [Paraburkholderia guartelaensis]TDG10014.1 hypothetical protein E1N52_05770 [Paraburkholderia guartelaensis]